MKKFNSAMQFIFGVCSFVGFVSFIVVGSQISKAGYMNVIHAGIFTLASALGYILFRNIHHIGAHIFAKKIIRDAKSYRKWSKKCNTAFLAYNYVKQNGKDTYSDAYNEYLEWYDGSK